MILHKLFMLTLKLLKRIMCFGTETCLHATSDSVRKDSKVCCVYIFNTLVNNQCIYSGVCCMQWSKVYVYI